MPAFESKKYHWNETFHQKGESPQLPPQLTKKWWEKHKQVTTFLSRSTGVRAELEALEKEFAKLMDGWPRLPSNATRLDATLTDIDNFTTSGALKAFRERLTKIEKLAKEQAKELGGSSAHKKSAAALTEMAEVAEALKVACNASSLGDQRKEALEAWRKDQGPQLRMLVERGIKSIEGVLAKSDTVLKALRADIDTFEKAETGSKKAQELDEKISYTIFTLFRDTTTGIGNVNKAPLGAIQVDNYELEGARKLHAVMSKISERPDASFAKGISPEKQREYANDLEKHWRELHRVADGAKLV